VERIFQTILGINQNGREFICPRPGRVWKRVWDFYHSSGTIDKGTLYTFEIEPEMIAKVKEKARAGGLGNIVVTFRDFVEEATGLEANSIDYVMLFNILHAERPEGILLEAWHILKPGGRIGIIHWNNDPATLRGPSMEIRPKPDQCIEWAVDAGLKLESRHDLKPYHYGLVFRKPPQIE
jgi:SAM-dependent methyltransferase